MLQAQSLGHRDLRTFHFNHVHTPTFTCKDTYHTFTHNHTQIYTQSLSLTHIHTQTLTHPQK